MKKLLFILIFFTSVLDAQTFARTFDDPHGWDKHMAAGLISGCVAGGVTFWKTKKSGLTLLYTIGVPTALGAGKELSDKYLHTGVASWDDFAYTVYGGVGAVVGLGLYLSIRSTNKHDRELKQIQLSQ